MDGMSESPGQSAPVYSLLQQQLIALQDQRDRQIGQLTRLNRLSDSLLGDLQARSIADVFAEAVVDVLDVGMGAVWLLQHVQDVQDSFATCGVPVDPLWADAGSRLASRLTDLSPRQAIRLPFDLLAWLPGPDLVDGLICSCTDGEGRTVAVVLAANSSALAGLCQPLGEETLEVLSLLAEKLGVLLERESSRRQLSRQLDQQRRSEQRLAAVLKGTNDGWWDLDLTTGECYLSSRWLEMMGMQSEGQTFDGSFWRQRIHSADQDRFDWVFGQAMTGVSDVIDVEVRMLRDDQEYLPVLIRGSIFRDALGVPARFSGSMQDLTERKQQEAHIKRLAFYDVLTDLPNRRLLHEKIGRLIKKSLRDGHCFSLMLLDLDRFKTLNDTRGHAAGDQLLCGVADRIRDCLRPEDMVARLGGDEFVVLVQGLGSELLNARQRALIVAEKIRSAVAQPLSVDSGTIHQTVSIGLTLFDSPDLSGETLMQRADVALYEAKSLGRNSITLFRADMQRRINRRVMLEDRLHEACERGAFQVAYQIQVDADGRGVGAEALLRMSDMDGEMLPPSEFIPVAEESGLMLVMGDFMIDHVASDLHKWIGQLPMDFRLAINLGTSEFMHDDFVRRIGDRLSRLQIPGERLMFEITEDVILSDVSLAAYRMNQLKEVGVAFSLDDFGTGHSSLSYLRHLPVSEIKIDRSFVRHFLYEAQDHAIVQSIISLADSLALRVVAEGVETQCQYQRLAALGCRFFQGFLFDHPLTDAQSPLLMRLQRDHVHPCHT